MFTPAKLRATVEETLANTDVDLQGKQGVFLLVADLHGVKAVTAIRVGEHWAIQAAVKQPWKGELEANAVVKATW